MVFPKCAWYMYEPQPQVTWGRALAAQVLTRTADILVITHNKTYWIVWASPSSWPSWLYFSELRMSSRVFSWTCIVLGAIKRQLKCPGLVLKTRNVHNQVRQNVVRPRLKKYWINKLFHTCLFCPFENVVRMTSVLSVLDREEVSPNQYGIWEGAGRTNKRLWRDVDVILHT